MGRGQKRGRTQRRHFKQSRENVWKYGNNDSKKGRPDGDRLPTSAGDPSDPDPEPTPNPNPNPSWQPFATKNPNFDEYYKEQGILPIEEWDAFVACLRMPLPAAFRINASGQFYQDIKSQLENDFMRSLEAEVTNESEVEAIRPLPWYPGNLAWHLNFSRMQLRKNQMLERFHEFLKQENEIGNITRQEAVSMVPPLFLNVLPEHSVFDMCAAPGSKTFQLLEMMHRSAEVGSLPSGLVIANDVDVQRCNLLIHQTKRMCSANLIVTNHEAQHFPSCHFRSNIAESVRKDDADCMTQIEDRSIQGSGELISSFLFDCVLCDVPCSGDGTLRKAPDIWRKWHSGMGNGLHVLQVHIAMRGLALLKVGGRMVYSTCSMNPVENEAVVSEILYRCGAAVELLDVSNELPDLVRRPGLRKWKVRDKGLWLSSFSDVPAHRQSTILPSMFPCRQNWASDGNSSDDKNSIDDSSVNDDMDVDNSDVKSNHNIKHADNTCQTPKEDVDLIVTSEDTLNVDGSKPSILTDTKKAERENISNYPLERCMRIVPHDQNSGAFFIAVFRKVSALTVIPEKRQNFSRHSGGRRNDADNANRSLETGNEPGRNVPEVHISGPSSDQSGSDANLADKQEYSQTKDVEHMPGGHGNIKETEDGEAFDVDRATREVEKKGKGKLQIQGKWKGIDPVVFFEDDLAIHSIKEFYGISPAFPLTGHLISRNEDLNHVKRIYYISKSVQDVLKLNFKVGQRFKIASLGLKMFERQTSKDGSPCAFRISSEGLPLLLPHINKQILYASLIDFQRLLKYRNIKFAEFSEADFSEKASKLSLGCCIVVLNKGIQSSSDHTFMGESAIAIVCWKGRTSLSIMVSYLDGRELLERIAFRFKTENMSNVEDDKSSHGVQIDTTAQPADELEDALADAPSKPEATDMMEVKPDN